MTHAVVSHRDWISARRKLLAKEKEFTRARDELTRLRQAMPWERVEREYQFQGSRGKRTLTSLFEGRSQLLVYHFMFAPGWSAGCPHCSHWADSFDSVIVHLNQRDVTMVAVSRAPYAKLAAYRKRMGWTFPWYSSGGSDFNFDFNVSFTPEELKRRKALYNYKEQDPGASDREGLSVFLRERNGSIFHTYSTFARGIDLFSTDYNYLDVVPKGRDEGGKGPYWVKRHDEY